MSILLFREKREPAGFSIAEEEDEAIEGILLDFESISLIELYLSEIGGRNDEYDRK